MRIEADLKLGFKDVMIRPKRSTLKSRSEVSLIREFKFRNSELKWQGIQIIAANMDTVGTFEMAAELARHNLITAIHKHYNISQWSAFIKSQNENIFHHITVSTGTGNTDTDKLNKIINEFPGIKFICIDVANGYS